MASSSTQSLMTSVSTPRSIHNEINAIIESLSSIGIPIRTRDEVWSPSKHKASESEQCIEKIKILYYKNSKELHEILEKFKSDLRNHNIHGDKLIELLDRLKDPVYLATRAATRSSKLTDHFKAVKTGSQALPVETHETSPFVKPAAKTKPPETPQTLLSHPRRVENYMQGTTTTGTTLPLFRSGSSTTATSFNSTSFNSAVGTSFASTVATSFGGDGAEEECPSSTFDTEYTPSQAEVLLQLGAPISISRESKEDCKPIPPKKLTIGEEPSCVLVKSAPASLQHHLLKNLHLEPLCDADLPEQLHRLPFSLRFECLRSLKNDGHHIESLLGNINNSTPADAIGKRKRGCPVTISDGKRLQNSVIHWLNEMHRIPKVTVAHLNDEAQRSTFEIKMSFSKSGSKSVFDCFLHSSLASSSEPLSRLQRKFGSTRFLYVEIPEPPSGLCTRLSSEKDELRAGLARWACSDKTLLGTNWQPLHVEKRKDSDDTRAGKPWRLILFAVSGANIEPVALEKVLEYAIPFQPNLNQPFCKAFARIKLSLSKTVPTVAFLPSQIRFVKDTFSDRTPEDTRFNDPNMEFTDHHSVGEIMNDGCSRMSWGAAAEICKPLGTEGCLPAVLQGRINGAKGLWTVDAPYGTGDREIWLEITDSQLKVMQRPEDMLDHTCESDRWTFELVNSNGEPRTSHLYTDFLPILEDRGVSPTTLHEKVRSQLHFDFTEVKDALEHPDQLRRWISKIHGSRETRNREKELKWMGGLPSDNVEKVIMLLDAGFNVKHCSCLGEYFQSVVNYWMSDVLTKLKIRLPKSTMIYGIADPYGVLRPGEVYLSFSVPFTEKETGESWRALRGDVLVTRHPALRHSDIQRVTAVHHERLAHLTDVIVFPSKGCIPLASKLQGGDYDGDTFWVCWDDRLVNPFLNAPIPKPKRPEYYNIKIDKRTLGKLLGPDRDDVRHWLRESFNFRFQDDLLGQVTNYHKRLVYRDNSVSSAKVSLLADLHHMIIDASKGGLSFTHKDFEQFQREHGLGRLSIPIYEELISLGVTNKRDRNRQRREELKRGYNQQNIHDAVIVEDVLPLLESFKKDLESLLAAEQEVDRDVQQPWKSSLQFCLEYQDRHNRPDSHVPTEVLKYLEKELRALVKQWKDHYEAEDDRPSNSSRSDVTRRFHERYTCILPTNQTHPVCLGWLQKDSPYGISRWETIRASALMTILQSGPKAKTKLAFLMAGRELCSIKSQAQPNSHFLSSNAYRVYRPRTSKTVGLRSPFLSENATDSETGGEVLGDDDSDSSVDS